jgi:uncharacterized protein (DUF1501 family)
MNRRTFITVTGAGAASAALGLGEFFATRPHKTARAADAQSPESTGPAPTAPAAPAAAGPVKAAPTAKRRLVIVELEGGNDGMATLVPYGDGRYHALRSSTAVNEEDLLALDERVALHAKLAPLQQRGLAIVQGVGVAHPDLSHFAMMQRWWTGDPEGTAAPGTGFLGRLCDAIGDPAAPFVGLAIGSGAHPSMVSRKVNTLSLPGADAVDALATPDDPYDGRRALLEALDEMAADSGTDGLLSVARDGTRHARALADSLHVGGDQASGYPGGDLSGQLQLAAGLLAAQDTLRVVHVGLGGFDTHQNEPDIHPGLLEQFAGSVAAFLDDITARGLGGQILVATTSEFGRRAKDNGSNGLDHGAASIALLAGAVNPGLYGEYPSLSALDEDDDLVATVGMADYYGTLAEAWFGVPAGDVMAGGQPIAHLVA